MGQGPRRDPRKWTGRSISQSSGWGQRQDNRLQQNTNEYAVQRVRRKNETKMARKLGRKFKGSPNKSILSEHIRPNQIEDIRNLKLHCTPDRTRENQSLPTPVPTIGQCNMSLQEGRTDYGALDIPLHLASTLKGNAQKGNTQSRKLATKQTRPNNQTLKIIFEIHKLNRIWQTITETV